MAGWFRWCWPLVCASCGRIGFDGQAGAATDSYSTAVVADGAVAYWRLDETQGPTAFDLLGRYDGQYSGGCTLGVAGALTSGDTAVELDGSNCTIVVGDVLEFAGATPFTLELWANLAKSDSAVRWLVSHETQPGIGYEFLYMDTTLWFEQDSGGATSLAYVPASLPSLGAFHHLAITTDSRTQTIYVDGAPVAQRTFTVSEPANSGALQFGEYLASDPNTVQGVLDEIAIYDRALDPATIAAHYAAR